MNKNTVRASYKLNATANRQTCVVAECKLSQYSLHNVTIEQTARCMRLTRLGTVNIRL